MLTNTPSLRFDERPSHLRARVDAHKRFAAFDLNDWIEEHFEIQSGQTVVDLGCGNGNHLPIWIRRVGQGGKVISLDKSPDLLRQAKSQILEGQGPQVLFLCADMDGDLPLKSEDADWVIACFSIYYVRSAEEIVRKISRALKPGGTVAMVGPTWNNAKELYEFHERATGIPMPVKAAARSERLQKEFLPVLKEVFSKVDCTVLENKLSFPAKEDFLQYYLNTPLVVESGGTQRMDPLRLQKAADSMKEWIIRKETIVIRACGGPRAA